MVITLSTPMARVTVRTERGGKITSLFHRPSGREWLEAAQGDLDGPPPVNRAFDDGDMCGWDEMMPTIEACRLETGLVLDDHGELWRQPWEVLEHEETSLTTRVRDDVMGYQFERTLRLDGATLHLSYRVQSDTDVDHPVLWAAHPLFAARRGTRIALRGDVVALDDDGTARRVGPWPQGVHNVDDLGPGESRKLYVRLSEDAPTAALFDENGPSLTMRWSRLDAPFVGVWLDNGAYSRHPVVALEPTNGAHDSLAVASTACHLPRPWTLTARGERRWSVTVEMNSNERGENR